MPGSTNGVRTSGGPRSRPCPGNRSGRNHPKGHGTELDSESLRSRMSILGKAWEHTYVWLRANRDIVLDWGFYCDDTELQFDDYLSCKIAKNIGALHRR